MKRFGVIASSVALIVAGLTLFPSCSGSGSKADKNVATSRKKRPFSVEPGALEGTYLKVLWTYEHNKDVAGLYFDKGVILFVTEDNELVKLDPVTGLPFEHVLRLKTKLRFPPAVYRYLGEGGATTEIYVMQEGDTLWCIEGDTMLELWAEDLNYGVACAPSVSKDMVFLAAEGGRINSVRKEGRTESWTYSADKTIVAPPVLEQSAQLVRTGGEAGAGQGVSTAVRDADFLYVASEDNSVYRLNVFVGWKHPGTRGGHSWRADTRAKILTSPVSYLQRVFAASMDSTLYAFEEVDGVLAWKYQIGQYVRQQPRACWQTIFFLGEDTEGGPRTMYAVNARNGKCRWTRTVGGVGRSYEEDGLPGVAQFLAPGKELAYVLAQDKPEIWAVRIDNGTVVHRIGLSDTPDFVVSHDAQHGRAAGDLGLILLGTKSGKILALKERRLYAEK